MTKEERLKQLHKTFHEDGGYSKKWVSSYESLPNSPRLVTLWLKEEGIDVFGMKGHYRNGVWYDGVWNPIYTRDIYAWKG